MTPAEEEAIAALRAWDREHDGMTGRPLMAIGPRLCLAMTRLAEEAPTIPSAPIPKRVSSGTLRAVQLPVGHADRVTELLDEGKHPPKK